MYIIETPKACLSIPTQMYAGKICRKLPLAIVIKYTSLSHASMWSMHVYFILRWHQPADNNRYPQKPHKHSGIPLIRIILFRIQWYLYIDVNRHNIDLGD